MMYLPTINLRNTNMVRLANSNASSLYLFVSCLFLLAGFSLHVHAEASKIVKWKDANGVTHYGDKLPAQDAGRGNSVLNKQGTVVKTNESFNPNANTQEIEKVSAEQLRQDSALLASYSSVEEIELAQNRNLKSDQLALQALQQRQEDLKKNLRNLNTKFSGKKMPPHIVEEVKGYQLQILKNISEIKTVESSISQTTARFANYKQRYLELRPRDQNLTYIKAKKKTLTELQAWKADANTRLNFNLDKALSYKRAGIEAPPHVRDGIEQANREVARADEEIAEMQESIKKSQQSFIK